MPKIETDVAVQRIEIVRSFFERLDGFKRKEQESIPPVGRFLERFSVASSSLRQEEQNWQKATAPNFNVFRVLHLQRRETKLHSRFLAELLDPRGSHGQADRFLTAFLDAGKNVGFRCPSQWPTDAIWEITTEEVVSESDRLDIVLRCPAARFVMVIENKVDAAEGSKQLSRYYEDWLKKQPADFRNLVFLTPDGREPETISVDKCSCLSYRDHITGWLRKLVDKIEADRLRFAIDQYLQVVESF